MDLKEVLYFNKKKIFIGVIFLLLIVCFVFFYYRDSFIRRDDHSDSSKEMIVKNDVEVDVVAETCFVDIKGEVKNPGVYEVNCDGRVKDVLDSSGGLTKNSDTSVINLSKKIKDEMVIIVYSKKEVDKYLETKEKENFKNEFCNSFNVKNDACIENDNSSGNTTLSQKFPININTASLQELMMLSGIGESKAKNIISYREKNPFKTIEDLLEVDGIGESIYSQIKENITV